MLKDNDFWRGLESGYPVCCIQYFCNFWIPVREQKLMFSGKECHDYSTGVGYVQCPECIVKDIKRNS